MQPHRHLQAGAFGTSLGRTGTTQTPYLFRGSVSQVSEFSNVAQRQTRWINLAGGTFLTSSFGDVINRTFGDFWYRIGAAQEFCQPTRDMYNHAADVVYQRDKCLCQWLKEKTDSVDCGVVADRLIDALRRRFPDCYTGDPYSERILKDARNAMEFICEQRLDELNASCSILPWAGYIGERVVGELMSAACIIFWTGIPQHMLVDWLEKPNATE